MEGNRCMPVTVYAILPARFELKGSVGSEGGQAYRSKLVVP